MRTAGRIILVGIGVGIAAWLTAVAVCAATIARLDQREADR